MGPSLPTPMPKRPQIERPSIGLDLRSWARAIYIQAASRRGPRYSLLYRLTGETLAVLLSLTSRSRDSMIIAVGVGMFVPVWFIVVAIGLLIAVALHSCDEDRGRKRARLSQWSL